MAETALSLLPQCAQAAALAGITSSGCGVNVACLCTNTKFLLTLQGVITTQCSPADGQKTFTFAKQLCTAAVPSLNDSRVPMIIGVLSTLMVLSIAAVIARLVARRIAKVALWWDDCVIIVALALTIGLNINNLIAAHFGWGRHVLTLTLAELSSYAKVFFASQILFGLAITATKLAILVLYCRIFPSRKFKIAAIAAAVLNIVWCIALTISVPFSCKPVEYAWDKTIPGGSCANTNTRAYWTTAANFLTDLVVWLLPIPVLWGLQMQTSRKLAVIGMFLLGGIVCLAPLIRLPLFIQLNVADITWTIVNAGVWINVECNLGIVCACLPSLRPLFRGFSLRSSLRSRSSKYTRTESRAGGSSGLRTSSSERIVDGKADDTRPETAQGVAIAMPELPKREQPWSV